VKNVTFYLAVGKMRAKGKTVRADQNEEVQFNTSATPPVAAANQLTLTTTRMTPSALARTHSGAASPSPSPATQRTTSSPLPLLPPAPATRDPRGVRGLRSGWPRPRPRCPRRRVPGVPRVYNRV